MKTELLVLFANTPVLADKPAAFLDSLADDLQAVIIASLRAPAHVDDDHMLAFDAAVDDVWVSTFGLALSSLHTLQDFPGKRKLHPGTNNDVVRAMIGTMLLMEEEFYDQAATIKGRLADLANPPALLLQ